jgi:hypothetical protein
MIYAVFRQGTPQQRGDEWVANLIYMGNVEAANSDEAFRKAKSKYCGAPVLQEGGCNG